MSHQSGRPPVDDCSIFIIGSNLFGSCSVLKAARSLRLNVASKPTHHFRDSPTSKFVGRLGSTATAFENTISCQSNSPCPVSKERHNPPSATKNIKLSAEFSDAPLQTPADRVATTLASHSVEQRRVPTLLQSNAQG
jgi:hypothetical protein